MKMRQISMSAAILSLAFLICLASASLAFADPVLWFSGTPANGQFNNGLISPTGPGATEASTKLYYLSSSQATSRPKVGITLHGAGFEPNRSVGFSIDGKQGEPTEPWGTGNYSLPPAVTTDENGEFEQNVSFSRASPSAYNKFDYNGGEQLIIYPTYPETKTSENPDGRVSGAKITLTIKPTVIVLPRALDPISMFAGADYSFAYEDAGVASMTSAIIDDSSRQVRLAVAGMSMRGPGNTELPRENDAWILPNGITASVNADSSYLVLRTPESGVTDELSGTFSILGTGAAVVDDGFASVVGFPKTSESQIATLNLSIKKSGRSAAPKTDSVTFTNNETTNAAVQFDTNPPNLAIGDLKIIDPATGERADAIEISGGLVMAADPDNRRVTFSGTPHIDGGTDEGTYEIVWITTDGEALSSSVSVAVSAGSVYAPMYNETVIGDGLAFGFWQKGVKVPDDVTRAILVSADGAPIPILLSVDGGSGLDGLDIAVNGNNTGITISGTPSFSGLKTFYVNVALDPSGNKSGTISPNRVPVSVFVDDADYKLTFDKEKLDIPVGKDLSANVNMLFDPKYDRDMIPRDFQLTGDDVTVDGDGLWHWNGLTITPFLNTATWNAWLEVSGEAEKAGSVELTYAPSRGKNNMSSATLTIEAHADENVPDVPETVVTNHDDPIVTTSGDVRYENPVAGETTKIIYIISGDMGQSESSTVINNYFDVQSVNLTLPDGTIIPLSHLNDNTAANPFDSSSNSYYFDRASGQIILYVTPESVGDYLLNVYFKDASELKVRPINLNVTRTVNYYYAETNESGGGGGCGAGAAAGFALLLAAAAALTSSIRSKSARFRR
ncbi:MAG: hypothetical protein LBG29_09655 [Synergistaceae bacterium]|jgi:hypothetical protein|nr:hypothetical protein [Synergistaceae bacterium]